MKKTINILLSTLALLFIIQVESQAQFKKSDLIGAWKISLEHIIESLPPERKAEYDKLPDEQKKATIMMIQQMVGKIRWEFKKDGTTKVNLTGNEEKSGTWKMKGDKVWINTESQKREMKLLILTADKLKFSSVDDKGQKIIMTLVPVK